MSPNGRRAWRKWVRRQDLRRKHKQPKGSVCRMARQARRHLPLVPGVVPSEPFTARALVGMTMGARKRAWEMMGYLRSDLRIGERLRPCPGCCACKSRMLTFRELKRFFPAMAHAHPHVLRRVVEKGSWRCGSMVVSADTDPMIHRDDVHCDGSGVLPARKS